MKKAHLLKSNCIIQTLNNSFDTVMPRIRKWLGGRRISVETEEYSINQLAEAALAQVPYSAGTMGSLLEKIQQLDQQAEVLAKQAGILQRIFGWIKRFFTRSESRRAALFEQMQAFANPLSWTANHMKEIQDTKGSLLHLGPFSLIQKGSLHEFKFRGLNGIHHRAELSLKNASHIEITRDEINEDDLEPDSYNMLRYLRHSCHTLGEVVQFLTQEDL